MYLMGGVSFFLGIEVCTRGGLDLNYEMAREDPLYPYETNSHGEQCSR